MDNILITDNHDIIIKFIKENIKMFKFDDNNIHQKYICKLIFENTLGTVIKELIMSDIDVSILLDNIYYYMENNCDTTFIYFNPINTDCISSCIKLDLIIDKEGYYYNQILSIFDYIDEQLIEVCSFIINDIYEFCNKLYYAFLVDNNEYSNYDPNLFFESEYY